MKKQLNGVEKFHGVINRIDMKLGNKLEAHIRVK